MKSFLIKCIQACINSYEGKHGKVKKIFDVWQKNVKDNIEYYFGIKNNVLNIVFRGSDKSEESQKGLKGWFKRLFAGWKDWAQNLDTHSIDVDGGEMHLGIFEDNMKIQRHCENQIKKYDTINIIGHSKGAMQAGVLSYFMQKLFPKKDIQPVLVAPAGFISKKLLKALDNAIVIMNGEDFICKIPQWKFVKAWKFKRFIHIGKQNIGLKIPLIRAIGAKDHYPQKYLESMKKYNKVIL